MRGLPGRYAAKDGDSPFGDLLHTLIFRGRGIRGSPHEPGSLVVWHGTTWHGAFNRRAPGLRVSIPVLMARPFMRTEEDLFCRAPEQVLERNSPRFAYLVQQGIVYGFHSDESAEARNRHAYKHIMAYNEESGGVMPLDPSRIHLYG